MNQIASIDYKKVFSKLSHIKALSHDDKFDQIVQNVIMLALNQGGGSKLKTEADVANKIVEIYGISIRLQIIQSNIDKLIALGDIAKDRVTKHYSISIAASAKINRRLEDANNLEARVKEKWFEELKLIIENLDDTKLSEFWNCLKSYLSYVFEQHGIQTLQLLNPNAQINEDDQKGLSSIVDKVIKENVCSFSKEELAIAINQFIIKADETRTSYTSQLADATFTSFALTSDAEIVNFLNTRYNNLKLFLDTNFIFGILDLHKNSEDASAREIIDEVKKNRLPFKLYYHPETLAEFKRAFDVKALHIRASKWTRESSRLAIAIDGLSPLEELFHKENLENEIDPTIFLDKYNHVDLLLKDFGLHEYQPYETTDLEHGEIESNIGDYQQFYEATPNRKPKSYAGFKHDIVVLREVRSLNPRKTKFLESNAFFISSDFVLAKFEKVYFKKHWEINYVVSPSVFLQLIRPFIQNDYTSNKRFIDTFSIPDFRSFEIDYSTTRSKTLQILNDNYHDTSFETKVKILRDQVLLEKLEKVNESHESQIQIIENQIALENKLLSQQKLQVEESIKLISKENETIQQEKIQAKYEVAEKQDEILRLKQNHEEESKKQKIEFNRKLVLQLNKSIDAAEKSHIPLQEVIDDKMKTHIFLLALIPVIFYSIIFFLIYKLTWDVMEPFTYAISILFLIAGYLYFAIKGADFDPRHYFRSKKVKIKSTVYKNFNFDESELTNQRAKVAELLKEIKELEPGLEE
ncbi:MAG: hypothetical protein BGO54_08010 [Sphingobacteriales bacterium 46-32]|nr:MAG: hypothetical protein BGO54_08010 [Sphingobacteriales bacterium 46-32]